MTLGDCYGAHRVIEPAGALPQAASRLHSTIGEGTTFTVVLTIVR